MTKTLSRASLLGLATLAFAADIAAADDLSSQPVVFGGEIATKLQGEVTKPAGNGAKETIFDDSELSAYLNWSDWLSVNTDLKLERQRNDNLDDFYPKTNSAFRSEGLTLRQLYATVRPMEGLSLYGGKIHPKFGSAYANTPGIFYNFGTDYEQDERIGGGIAIALPESFGEGQFSAETYYLDTSELSNSLLSRPSLNDDSANRLRKYTQDAGGPSNTGKLNSYTLALRGEGFAGVDGLKYQISYTHEAVAQPDEKPEQGFSVGLSYEEIPLSPRMAVTPFVEYTHFNNFSGVADLDRSYAIAGTTFIYGHWNLALSAGLRKSRDRSNEANLPWTNALATQENDAWDQQENITLTYEVVEHLVIGAGINHARIADRSSNSFGPSLSYTRAF